MWTKAHSHRAVAARSRRRQEQLHPGNEPIRRIAVPRPAADFVINIRARSGDRLQLSITRIGRHLRCGDGHWRSARQIGRAIEVLLRHASC